MKSSTAFASEYTKVGIALGAAIVLAGLNQRPALVTLGPVTNLITADTGLSTSIMGIVAALPLAIMGLAAIAMPSLARRFSMDNLVVGNLIGLAVATAIRSYVPGLGLWIGTIGIGITIGLLNAVLPAVIKRDFPMRAATVTGIYSIGLTSGAAFSAGVAFPIAEATSWRTATGIWTILAVIGVLAWAWGMVSKARAGVGTGRKHSDDDAALTSDSDARLADDESLPTAVGNRVAPEGKLNIWTSPRGWAVTIYTGLQLLFFYVIVQWMPSMEAEMGIDGATAGTHLTYFQLAGLTASLLITALAREMRDQRVLAVGTPILAAVVGIGFIAAPSLAVVWVIIAGFGAGGSFVTALSFISTRSSNAGDAAELSGMSQSLGYFIAAVGPALAGMLATNAGTWNPVLILLTAVAIVLAVIGLYVGRDTTLR